MTQKTELKRCPFCGGSAQFNEHDEECYFTKLLVAKGGEKTDMTPLVELITAWNRRAALESKAQDVQMPEPVGVAFIFETEEGGPLASQVTSSPSN